MDDGVSRELEFWEAEEKRGSLWDLAVSWDHPTNLRYIHSHTFAATPIFVVRNANTSLGTLRWHSTTQILHSDEQMP